jgi:hypothetical protein
VSGGTSAGAQAGKAKGGAVFAINTLLNSNGNEHGMPDALPVVTGCANSFGNSVAADAGSANNDNVDVYGADRLGLTLSCGDRIFADGVDGP